MRIDKEAIVGSLCSCMANPAQGQFPRGLLMAGGELPSLAQRVLKAAFGTRGERLVDRSHISDYAGLPIGFERILGPFAG